MHSENSTIRLAVLVASLVVCAGHAQDVGVGAQASQQPVFKSGVELIAVDVAIVDKDGRPIAGVRPDQFEVTVDGKPRRVVSAEFIEYASRDKPSATPLAAVPVARPLSSSNQDPVLPVPHGRLIFLAVDQGSFRSFGARGAMEAARRFIDRLQPADRVGLVAFPPPGPSVPASRDHAAVRAATAQILGSATPFRMGVAKRNVSLAEAIDIHGGESEALERVMTRECPGAVGLERAECEADIRVQAANIGLNAEIQAFRSLAGIGDVIRGLAQIRERKTLVLISAGLPVADRIGRDLQLISTVASLGRDAAAANLNFHVLHVDSGFLDAFSASERTMSDTLFRDLGIMSGGLETIAGASGGSLARVVAGADFAFDRVLRETSAAYLLGVEPAEGDRDGKTHRINVKVKLPGAEVRSRRELVFPKIDARPATPEDALVAAFRADRPATGLPIRVATHSMAADANGGYRVYLSAEIGEGHTGPVELQLLYAVTDATGRTLPPVRQKQTLAPRPTSRSHAVSYIAQNILKPGSYTLRFAAVDSAGRAGSVDHAFAVGLTKGDGVRISDLLLLEPRRRGDDRIEVITNGELRGTAVEAYVEVAPATQTITVTGVTFGVADRPDGAPLVSVPVRVSREGGTGHWSAEARLDLALLPPGDYVAMAIVSAGARPIGRVVRPIHIDREAASAGRPDAGASPAPRISFVAGESGSLVKVFSRQDVLGRDTLEFFLGRLRSAMSEAAERTSVKPAADALLDARFDEALVSLAAADPKRLSTTFLKGLALLGKGELDPAAAQFRASIDVAPDFLPAAFYLGACYAAGGRDREAVGAWQTALISESDARIIYDVLGDALLRLQDGEEAASLLGEARDKWADDDRFLPRLAASEALRRRPREAMALLDAYIARHPSDADALFLAVRLLYDARSADRRISSVEEDAAAAGRYAALYKAAGGSNVALVQRWATFIGAK